MKRKPDNGLTIEQRTSLFDSASDMVPKMVNKYSRRNDREDAQQSCYLQLWKATRTYNGDPSVFRQYASKVITNALIGIYHHNKAIPEYVGLPFYVADRRNALRVVDITDLFVATMRRFYPDERRVMQLLYVEYKTFTEIADKLGVTISKAHKIHTRAIERLRWEEKRKQSS